MRPQPIQQTAADAEPRRGPTVRGAVVDDVPAIRAFLGELPARSFSQASEQRVAAYWATPDDATDHYGVIATDADGRIVGHAAYIRLYGSRAELTVDLADGLDRVELVARLVRDLARVARDNRISRFVTVGPAGASGIVELFASCPTAADDEPSWSVVEFPTDLVTGVDD